MRWLPQRDRGDRSFGAILRYLEPAPAEPRFHQDFLDRLLADAMIMGPPTGEPAREDFEGVRDRYLDVDGLAHGRDDSRLVHSLAPSRSVGFFRFQLERLQRIAPETVEPLAQFVQALSPHGVNPAHALAPLRDEPGVF